MGTIGEVIGKHHSEVVQLWAQAAQHSPSARGLSPPEIESTMPAFLSLLGGGADVQLTEVQHKLVEHHLSSRLRSGFNLNEILTEYASLGRYVFQLMKEVDQPLEASARISIELLWTAMEVTKIFHEQLLEDEQTLKRYTRLLQEIASEAVEPNGQALASEGRLEAVLKLIMDAMDAHTAALLLFDVKTDELIMSASAGDAHETLAAHVSVRNLATYTGRVASLEGAVTALDDAATTDLEITDELRASGIHSLVGVRLAAHRLLRGVLYVGTREKRAFTASEERRLESLGEALTVHLDNARLHAALRQKIDQANVAEKLRERFVSVLMHDLQEPLRVARERTRHLFDDRGSPHAEAAQIAHSLDRMRHMIDDLLDTHRLGVGERLPLTIAECNAGAVAAEIVDEMRVLYGDRFVLQAEKVVRGMWDRDQLYRALWNLLTNALEHGQKDAPIFVSVKSGAAEAELAVHNAGRAISAEQQGRLFKPFAHPRLAETGPSEGIGLALVWGCAEAHGGRVEVTSALGRGTTFTLYLPWDARPYVDSAP
ncbi:MAG: sasA [Myxococcales bacterium]|nr:sasA [Myxococcales bacterium]